MLLAGAVVAGFMLGRKHGNEIEKTKKESETAASSASAALHDAVNTGKQMASELGTNLETVGREGAKKAGELATNVAAKTKVMASNVVNKVTDATTNVVNQAKQKLEDVTH